MKILAISSLLSIFFFSSTDQKIDTEILIGKKWEINRAVEVLAGDTTIYGASDEEKKEAKGKTIFLMGALGGYGQFTTDSTGYYEAWPNETFTWKITNEKYIHIKIDSLTDDSKNRHFFGLMKIQELTDSSAILRKNISRNGRWTRTFYLSLK